MGGMYILQSQWVMSVYITFSNACYKGEAWRLKGLS